MFLQFLHVVLYYSILLLLRCSCDLSKLVFYKICILLNFGFLCFLVVLALLSALLYLICLFATFSVVVDNLGFLLHVLCTYFLVDIMSSGCFSCIKPSRNFLYIVDAMSFDVCTFFGCVT